MHWSPQNVGSWKIATWLKHKSLKEESSGNGRESLKRWW